MGKLFHFLISGCKIHNLYLHHKKDPKNFPGLIVPPQTYSLTIGSLRSFVRINRINISHHPALHPIVSIPHSRRPFCFLELLKKTIFKHTIQNFICFFVLQYYETWLFSSFRRLHCINFVPSSWGKSFIRK